MGQEEAERELQMERGADALDGFAQKEGEGRQEETQQREAQSHVDDHIQCGILLLGPSREKISHAFLLGGNDPSTVFICRHRKTHQSFIGIADDFFSFLISIFSFQGFSSKYILIA